MWLHFLEKGIECCWFGLVWFMVFMVGKEKEGDREIHGEEQPRLK